MYKSPKNTPLVFYLENLRPYHTKEGEVVIDTVVLLVMLIIIVDFYTNDSSEGRCEGEKEYFSSN